MGNGRKFKVLELITSLSRKLIVLKRENQRVAVARINKITGLLTYYFSLKDHLKNMGKTTAVRTIRTGSLEKKRNRQKHVACECEVTELD